jgi:ABC-type glycerol-3-phosphate transport system substrate-binding protein
MLRALGAWGVAGLATPVLLAACGGAAATVSASATTAAPTSAAVTATQAATSTAAAATTAATTSQAATSSAATTSAAASTTAAVTSAASSSTATAAAAASAPASGGVSLTFLHWWTGSLGADYDTYMKWAFDQYKQQTGVTVTGIPANPVTDTNQKFVTGVAGGQPPDAAFTSVVFGRDMYDTGLLANLDAMIAQAPDMQDDKFFAASKQFRETAGHTFGIPVMGPESLCLGINQDIFQTAGFDPKGADIKNWDDLVHVGQKLTKTGGDGSVSVAGVGTPAGMDIATFTAWVETTGHSLYDAEQNTAYYNAPETVAAMQFLADLAGKSNVGAPLDAKNRPTGETALAAGTAAMEFDETAMGSFPTIVKATALKWWMIPYPQAPTGKGPATATWINFTVIPYNGKHNADAFQFLRFFCGLPAAIKKNEVLHSDSPVLAFYDTPQWQSSVKSLPPQVQIPAIAKLPGVYPYHHNADQSKQIGPLLTAAYSGKTDVKTALDEAQRLADQIFAAKK